MILGSQGARHSLSAHAGFNKNLRHCSDLSCNLFVHFDYNLKLDGDECNLNPCRNNATCHDLISSYLCDCPSGYGGRQCEHIKGRLRVFIRNATDLPRRADGGFVSPYVNMVAYRFMPNNSRVGRTTYAARRILCPQWNHEIDFGVGEWFQMNIKVLDWDRNRTPRAISLSKWNSYFLNSHMSQTFAKMEADSGYILFDYHFELE